jgi:hypothetical protein
VDVRPHHPLISHVLVPAIARGWETVLQLDGRPEHLVSWLQHRCQLEPIGGTDGRHSASASSGTPATAAATGTVFR